MKNKVRIVSDFNNELNLKGFKAFQLESDSVATRIYNRKDFFKICLTTGKSRIHYSDRSFETEGTILFFGNPHIPYSWETLSSEYIGYTCLFSEDFLKQSERSEVLKVSPFFKIGETPILNITEEKRLFLNMIFKNMIEEQQSSYKYKDDLIRNNINIIIHEALKLEPSQNFDMTKNSAFRITSIFLELLERQFPIETLDSYLKLKKAQDYATSLNFHVNYLNRVVKETTGKTTTEHINERIIIEAKALLIHTDWNISEISNVLGFEYPTYFNNFFKKETGVNPKSFRAEKD